MSQLRLTNPAGQYMTYASLRHYLELLHEMTKKEIHARYKHAILGFLWIFINPLVQMIVIGFIFTFISRVSSANFFYYLFLGLLLWNFFSLSLTKGTPAVVHERALIKKASFPRAVIPLSIVLSNFIHFLLGLCLVIVPILFLGTISFLSMILLPVSLFLLLIFSIGLVLITSALNVRYRDVNFVVQALLTVWFYATPILYDVSVIPERYRVIWWFNPLSLITRLMYQSLLGYSFPEPAEVVIGTTTVVLTFTVGYFIFRSMNKSFDDWV